MRRPQAEDVFVKSRLARRIRQILLDARSAERGWNVGEEGLATRSERELPRIAEVVQRRHPVVVARQEEAPCVRIPCRKCPVAEEVERRGIAPLLERTRDDGGVRDVRFEIERAEQLLAIVEPRRRGDHGSVAAGNRRPVAPQLAHRAHATPALRYLTARPPRLAASSNSSITPYKGPKWPRLRGTSPLEVPPSQNRTPSSTVNGLTRPHSRAPVVGAWITASA